jgi:hypothetical protein
VERSPGWRPLQRGVRRHFGKRPQWTLIRRREGGVARVPSGKRLGPGFCSETRAGIFRGVGRERTHGSENACCELALWRMFDFALWTRTRSGVDGASTFADSPAAELRT